MSIGHTEMSIRPSNKQKCPLDIEMSIRPMDRWTLSDGKHSSLVSTWGYAQSYYVIIPLLSDAVKVTCPLGIMKCPLDIQECPFVHRTNRNVHWTFKCPLDILQRYWTLISVLCPFDSVIITTGEFKQRAIERLTCSISCMRLNRTVVNKTFPIYGFMFDLIFLHFITVNIYFFNIVL